MPKSPITAVVLGAGSRGNCYADYAVKFPDQLKIVGVAESRPYYRKTFAEKHRIPEECIFEDWKDLCQKSRLAEAAIIALPDQLHCQPAVALAQKGYHLLLEKPMATNPQDCQKITQAVLDAGIIFAVCHVLEYTVYTETIQQIIQSGAIGQVVNIHHLEPVGYWHMAHSYVRGNWSKETVSPMLLAKSCHDLDWIRYIAGCRCLKISSFGSLKHFRKENKPKGAALRCVDCPCEPNCPYSAVKIYLGRVEKGHTGWPVNILTPIVNREMVAEALRNGPYGRCVYECDNDVVDHQVVAMQFENDIAACFTMTAFSRHEHRKTSIFGTHGQIVGDGSKIEIYDFLTDQTRVIDTQSSDASIIGGHGGGDFGLMKSFVQAVSSGDKSKIHTTPQETLEAHLMVFAAEEARKNNCVVALYSPV